MTGSDTINPQHDQVVVGGQAVSDDAKEVWSKPEIVDYQPVTVAHGISWRIGDGISNLS